MNELLLKVRFGSHLYGTNTPESDTDYKSVIIPDGRDILMQSAPRVISNSTGTDAEKNSKDDIDDESFSIMKYFDMLRDGDMIATELLFIKPENPNVYWMHDKWFFDIHRERKYLISRNIKGFIGYIRKQANRYGIRGSRVATAREAVAIFSELMTMNNSTTKLREINPIVLTSFVGSNEHCQLLELPVAYDNNKTERFIEILNRKISFNVSLKEAFNIVFKIFEEYGSRSLAAEKNEGVDWKSLYHAIRVSEQAKELLSTGNIMFPRPNAKELLEIKAGAFHYKYVSERLEENFNDLEKLMLTSNLREEIDENYMNDLIEEYHSVSVKKYLNLI